MLVRYNKWLRWLSNGCVVSHCLVGIAQYVVTKAVFTLNPGLASDIFIHLRKTASCLLTTGFVHRSREMPVGSCTNRAAFHRYTGVLKQ